jgi:hypothetical protein
MSGVWKVLVAEPVMWRADAGEQSQLCLAISPQHLHVVQDEIWGRMLFACSHPGLSAGGRTVPMVLCTMARSSAARTFGRTQCRSIAPDQVGICRKYLLNMHLTSAYLDCQVIYSISATNEHRRP